MSGGLQTAKPAGGRPLDGVVRFRHRGPARFNRHCGRNWKRGLCPKYGG